MAKSIIGYRGQYFWVHDVYLEGIYCVMIDVMEEHKMLDYPEFIEALKVGMTGYYFGAADINIEELEEIEHSGFISSLLNVLKLAREKLVKFSGDNLELYKYLNSVRKKSLEDVKEDLFNIKYYPDKEALIMLTFWLESMINNKLKFENGNFGDGTVFPPN